MEAFIPSGGRVAVQRFERAAIDRFVETADTVISNSRYDVFLQALFGDCAVPFKKFEDSVCQFVAPHMFKSFVIFGHKLVKWAGVWVICHSILPLKGCFLGVDRGWRVLVRPSASPEGFTPLLAQTSSTLLRGNHPATPCGVI